jgi:hypothetical protein
MSQKTEQTTENIYNQGSMDVFNSLQTPVKNVLLDAMQNPFQSSFFNKQVQMLQKQNNAFLATQQGNILNNARIRGLGGSGPMLQSLIARGARGASANMNNAFLQALMNANQTRMQATGMAQGYQPLQTGEKKTVEKKGMGTWLPQAISTAVGIASAFMGNPAGLAGAAGGGAQGGGGIGGSGTGGLGFGGGLNMGGSGGYYDPLAQNPFTQFAGGR